MSSVKKKLDMAANRSKKLRDKEEKIHKLISVEKVLQSELEVLIKYEVEDKVKQVREKLKKLEEKIHRKQGRMESFKYKVSVKEQPSDAKKGKQPKVKKEPVQTLPPVTEFEVEKNTVRKALGLDQESDQEVPEEVPEENKVCYITLVGFNKGPERLKYTRYISENIRFEKEPENKFDGNAIKAITPGGKYVYVSMDSYAKLHILLDKYPKANYTVEILETWQESVKCRVIFGNIQNCHQKLCIQNIYGLPEITLNSNGRILDEYDPCTAEYSYEQYEDNWDGDQLIGFRSPR